MKKTRYLILFSILVLLLVGCVHQDASDPDPGHGPGPATVDPGTPPASDHGSGTPATSDPETHPTEPEETWTGVTIDADLELWSDFVAGQDAGSIAEMPELPVGDGYVCYRVKGHQDEQNYPIVLPAAGNMDWAQGHVQTSGWERSVEFEPVEKEFGHFGVTVGVGVSGHSDGLEAEVRYDWEKDSFSGDSFCTVYKARTSNPDAVISTDDTFCKLGIRDDSAVMVMQSISEVTQTDGRTFWSLALNFKFYRLYNEEAHAEIELLYASNGIGQAFDTKEDALAAADVIWTRLAELTDQYGIPTWYQGGDWTWEEAKRS